MNIPEALALLDPQDEGHWTEDGAPLLEMLSQLLETPVTREEVLEAAPLFTRINPQLSEQEVGPEDNPEVETKVETKETPVETAARTIPDHAQNILNIKVFRDSQRAQRAARAKKALATKTSVAAPIDAAFAHRRGRGKQRPTAPIK